MDYFLHVAYLCAVYAILCLSLDIIIVLIGDLSLAHAAFYGLGAYTSALATSRFGSFGALALGMALAVIYAMVLCALSLRLKGDYFVLATLGFAVIFTAVVTNLVELTGGAGGIAGIPLLSIFGIEIDNGVRFLFLGVLVLLLSLLLHKNLVQSNFGRVLRAIRDDEIFVESIGRNPFAFRSKAYAFSAAMAAMAGGLYAYYVQYIDPTSFSVDLSILLVAMVILGEVSTRLGSLPGAFVLIALPEALRFVGLSGPVAGNMRQILVGLSLTALAFRRSRGLPVRRSHG